MRKVYSLTTLAALVDQLQSDHGLNQAELRKRDRLIGKEIEGQAETPKAQLMAWLSAVESSKCEAKAEQAVTALRLALTALVVLGIICGWITAAALLHYDGSHPVNIIHVLAVFVGGQLLLLALPLLAFLPDPFKRFLPGFNQLREFFSFLSPERIQRFVVRRLPGRYRSAASDFLGKSKAHGHLFGVVEKWLFLRSGQAFGVAFNLGALASCLSLIVFTDLAFGWSTTLKVDAEDLQRIANTLSMPWSSFLPQATPSPELIEASRYFRAQTGSLPEAGSVSPEMLGGWWPFLILSILVYGLFPRLILLQLCNSRLKAEIIRAMLHLPGVQSLFDRLNSQLVETQAQEPEIGAVTELEVEECTQAEAEVAGRGVVVIDWSETGLFDEGLMGYLSSCFRGEVLVREAAGGTRTLDEDRLVLDGLSRREEAPVLILVKAWEPPMAEFADFLEDSRQAIGQGTPIEVVLLGEGSTDRAMPCSDQHRELWRTFVQRLGDPWTSLAPTVEESSE